VVYSFVSFVLDVFSFLRERIEGGDKLQANLLQGEQIRKKCGIMGTFAGTYDNLGREQGNKNISWETLVTSLGN